MYAIPLTPQPTQRVSVRIEGVLFELVIKEARSLMTVTITRDGKTAVSGMRCIPDTPLIPYRHMGGLAGNFYFFTVGGEYPHYSRFGGMDKLAYATAAELEAQRNGQD